jgi:drug/metabolite transporter (DMT)-like permease
MTVLAALFHHHAVPPHDRLHLHLHFHVHHGSHLDFALGLVAALLASAAFNGGIAMQALDAREAPRDQGLKLSLLTRLLRRKRWLLGGVIGLIGFPLQLVAFANAPFVVVQPALAAGLLLLLALGIRYLGERVGKVELFGVLAITAGIGLIAYGAPERLSPHRGPLAVTLVLAVLGVASLLPIVLRGRRRESAMLVIVASGLAFGMANIASKLLSDDAASHAWVSAGVWLAVSVAIGVWAILTEMTALQRAEATTVVPISFALQTFVPILLEPLFLRETFRSVEAYGLPIAAGLALSLAGMVAVARSEAVSRLAAGDVAQSHT